MEELGDCSSRQGPGGHGPACQAVSAQVSVFSGPDSERQAAPRNAFLSPALVLCSQQTPCDCISFTSFSRHWGCQRGQRAGAESLVGKHSGAPPRLASILIFRREARDAGERMEHPPSRTASLIQGVGRSVQAAVVKPACPSS